MASGGLSEDTEHPCEAPAASLRRSSPCRWAAILAAVRDQLPSLSPGSSALTQEAGRHSWEIWKGDLEGFGFQKQPEGVQVFAKEETEMTQDSRDHLEEEDLSRKQAMERGNSWLNTALSIEGLGTPEERRKLVKTKILSKVFLEPSPGHPELRVKPPSRGIDSSAERDAEEESPSDGHLQELTHLSLQHMEKWDQGKNPEELEQKRAALSSADHDACRSRSEDQLLEKPEELCARQCRAEPAGCGCPPAQLSSPEQQHNKAVAMLSSSSSPRRATMSSEGLPEPGTVCIDVREAKVQNSAMFPDGQQRRNCSGKGILLQQLRAARKEASELFPQTSSPAGRPEGKKQDPECLAKKDSSKISHTQCSEARQETAEVIPRKLRLQREERTPPVFSHRGSGADLGNGNQRAAEMAPNSGAAPEPPLAPTGLLRPEDSKRELSQKEEQRRERETQETDSRSSLSSQQPIAEDSPEVFHPGSSSG
ncbi:dynein axonemal assembly factor 8 isoform X2 [Pogoniulus pusillus]|uniref:dynein axonemal assembly factor 8 isoform X2 n=1 Tax=Pogoniulus pusillus TaxID=488313 RepID=UPI0030B95C6E